MTQKWNIEGWKGCLGSLVWCCTAPDCWWSKNGTTQWRNFPFFCSAVKLWIRLVAMASIPVEEQPFSCYCFLVNKSAAQCCAFVDVLTISTVWEGELIEAALRRRKTISVVFCFSFVHRYLFHKGFGWNRNCSLQNGKFPTIFQHIPKVAESLTIRICAFCKKWIMKLLHTCE